MKPKDEVIQEFNLQVNMSIDELQAWLDNPKSKTAGTGVGLESGHKILEILKKNPDKDPDLYEDEDIDHMRKVVGYNKRHMAQEDHLKDTKTKGELENTKSTISMRNWGHDPVKTLDSEEDEEWENSSEAVAKESSAAQEANAQKDGKPSASSGAVKRKHEIATSDVAPDQEKAGKDEAEDGPKEETEEGGDDGGEHVRKKSKVSTAEVTEGTEED